MIVYHPTPQEDPMLYYKQNLLKKYDNCERATKGLLRCINRKYYKMKIGDECVSFCLSHIIESISKVILLIMKEDWYIDYWDPIMNRWDTQQLVHSNPDEFVIYLRSLDENVQDPFNEPTLYTIIAFLQEEDEDSEDEGDKDEYGKISVDFNQDFIGTAYKQLLPRGSSFEERRSNEEEIESKSIENIVMHLFKYHELQPMDMVFAASAKTWKSNDIEQRFIFEDEDGDSQINIQFAPHIRCGNIKIPAQIEMDRLEHEDEDTHYFFVIHILIDFSR